MERVNFYNDTDSKRKELSLVKVVCNDSSLFRSEKFSLFVDNELLNPSIFIFLKIFLMNSSKYIRYDLFFFYLKVFILGDISKVLAENMTVDNFFDIYTLDKDNDIRMYLKTRLQLLIRSLNVTSLTNNDSIDRLLKSEYNLLTKAFQKLEIPF